MHGVGDMPALFSSDSRARRAKPLSSCLAVAHSLDALRVSVRQFMEGSSAQPKVNPGGALDFGWENFSAAMGMCCLLTQVISLRAVPSGDFLKGTRGQPTLQTS